MIRRTRRVIGAQTPAAHSDIFARSRSDLLGSRDLGCPGMEEVLRAPAAHGVSSIAKNDEVVSKQVIGKAYKVH